MEYVKRVLRVLAIALLSPLMVAAFCIGIVSMPLIYGIIMAYFYVKDGNKFDEEEADYCMNVVFDFFIEGIWQWPTKYILKLK